MSAKKLILSSSGLKNLVPGAALDDEFTFIFSEQNIKIKTVFAEFISPKVSKLHSIDPTLNCISFTDDIKGIYLSKNVISKLKLLSCGESIEITGEEIFQMKIISILLGNNDLYFKLNDLRASDINESNIDQYLVNLGILSKNSLKLECFDYSKIIDLISSHFYSIDKKKLKNLPKSVIYSIISNKNLTIESEDSLLDFIYELFEKNDESDTDIISFYEEIEFDSLSDDKLDEFAEKLNPSDMTHELWEKLLRCFQIEKNRQKSKVNQTRYKTKNCSASNKAITLNYDENMSHVFCGIIDHLIKKSGGNVYDNGTVNATSRSVNGDRAARNAVDIHNNKNFFQSTCSKDEWLKYDFINRKVHPTCYTIQNRHIYDNHHPRNWVIEASNTDRDNDWVILDTRTNDSSLTGLGTIQTFNIKEYEGCYRYVRIRQIGQNSSNSFYLTIGSLEYFGTLYENR